jgi:hypothetical protein
MYNEHIPNKTGGFIVGLKYKEGDKVVATQVVANNLGESFAEGTEFIVCRVDEVLGDAAMIPSSQPERIEFGGIWFYPQDCKTKFERVTEVVTGKCGQTEGRTPRVNYLYVVEDEDGAYVKTFDRGYAREVKADLGGKKAGVIITAYAAVKEIR